MNLLRLLVPLAEAADLTSKSTETAEQTEGAVGDFLGYLWNSLDNWIAAIVVVLFSVYFSKMLKKLVVDKVADKMGEEHEEVLILVGRATYAAVLGVGLTIGLKVGGIDLTVIIAAVGFGIGFALQDIIMNFIAGVIILASRQFAIGDFIEVNGILGKVKEIQTRATILQALDGTKVVVPNSDLFTNPVTSYTSNPFRRIEVPVGVEYRTDLKKATNVMLAVCHSNPSVIKEPAPAVILDEFADSSINFKVRFWVQSRDKWIDIKSHIINDLKAALDDAGINIPFPIRTLVFDRDTENATIPTYAMTAEEFKQHKMEQIQTQEEQVRKDAANPALQEPHDNGSGQSEHALEHAEMNVAAEPEQPAEAPAPAAPETAPQPEQPAEPTPEPTPQEPVAPTEPAPTPEEPKAPATPEPAPQPEQPVVPEPPTPQPSPEPQVPEQPVEPTPQPSPEAPAPTPQPEQEEKVDATATVTPVQPQQLAPEPVAAEEPVQPPAEEHKDTGADFLSNQ